LHLSDRYHFEIQGRKKNPWEAISFFPRYLRKLDKAVMGVFMQAALLLQMPRLTSIPISENMGVRG